MFQIHLFQLFTHPSAACVKGLQGMVGSLQPTVCLSVKVDTWGN